MGDKEKTYRVTTRTPEGNEVVDTIIAGNCSFTVSGDLVFEDSNREFLKTYARGFWLEVEEVKEGN